MFARRYFPAHYFAPRYFPPTGTPATNTAIPYEDDYMPTRQQNSTGYPTQFRLVLASDHVTPATGKTPTVTLSKNGGAFAAASGSVTEIDNGLYTLAGDASDRDTVGELWAYITASGCDPRLVPVCDVVVSDEFVAVYASGAGKTVSAERLIHDTHPFLFSLKLSSDHFTPATGKTPVLKLIQNGFFDNDPALGAITEAGNGVYAYTPDPADLNTYGDVWAYITADDCDSLTIPLCSLVFSDPFDNLTVDVGNTLIDPTWTLVDYLIFIGAAVAGKLSGAGTGTITLRALDDTFDALRATVEPSGNRTAVEYYP